MFFVKRTRPIHVVQLTAKIRYFHIPVLLKETMQHLIPNPSKPNLIFVDATFGRGGYTKEIFKISPNCKVIAFDYDEDMTSQFSQEISSQYKDKFTIIHENFANLSTEIEKHFGKDFRVDGIVFDLGVSSMQLDTPERGFSFRKEYDGPLDMRMNRKILDTAADVVNNMNERQLEEIIREYGEEKNARNIAKAIVAARNVKKFETTQELAKLIRSVKTKKYKKGGDHTSDVCTKTFQALRIYVNDELNNLSKALIGCEKILNSKGRLCVVSYHTLEDRIVKEFLKEKTKEGGSFKAITKKVIVPTDEEIERNPRSRSAKLRVLEKK